MVYVEWHLANGYLHPILIEHGDESPNGMARGWRNAARMGVSAIETHNAWGRGSFPRIYCYLLAILYAPNDVVLEAAVDMAADWVRNNQDPPVL